MKKNIIGLLLAFALILTIAVPGALVVRADETEAVAETVKALTDADCTCDGERDAEGKLPEGFVHGKECPLYVEPVVAPAPVSEPEAQGEDEPEKVCTCVVNEDGTLTYTEGCPVHKAPEVSEAPKHIEGCSDDCTVEGCTCTCHHNGESEKPTETETPAETEAPAHIEGCSDACTDENCACSCHLFNSLMSCETYEELMLLLDETPEEAFLKLNEEQIAKVEEKIQALEPQPLPPVILEESSDEPVVSEIIYPTVNYADAAPFGKPVVG